MNRKTIVVLAWWFMARVLFSTDGPALVAFGPYPTEKTCMAALEETTKMPTGWSISPGDKKFYVKSEQFPKCITDGKSL